MDYCLADTILAWKNAFISAQIRHV